MLETTVFTYRVSLSKTEWAKASAARKAAAELWTRLVKIHRFGRRRHWSWPTDNQLQAHFKKRFPLHSQAIQATIEKFIANIDATRTKRQNGDKNARYPHRYRRYYNPVFKGQSLKIQEQSISLPLGRGREPIKIHLPALPKGEVCRRNWGSGPCI